MHSMLCVTLASILFFLFFFFFFEDVSVVGLMCPVFTRMPDGVTVGDSGV